MTDGRAGKPGAEVVDFTEQRAARMEEKRRKTERIFFKQILGVYCVTGGQRMREIEIVDVSERGLSFQVPFDAESPWPRETENVPIRLYFSQDTYLPLTLRIQNSRPAVINGVKCVRYGCLVDPSISSFAAYEQFIRFLKLYAEHAHRDTGQATLFYL